MTRAIRLFDGIYLVGRSDWGGLKPLSGPGDGNVYLIDGGDELAIIDPGWGKSCKQIDANIRSAGFSLNRIKKVILTHYHADHSQGAWNLQRKLKIPVFAHFLEAKILLKGDGCRLGGYRWPFVSLEKLKPIRVDHCLHDKDVLKVGTWSFKVIHIPGHTPGGIGLLAQRERKRIFFSGDTAIGDQPRTGKGIIGWVSFTFGGNLGDYKRSLLKIKKLQPGLVFPGHGLPLTKNIQASLNHCLKRLAMLRNIPQLNSMMPIEIVRNNKK
jgi:glyoxylase-like metal-dependent hydrolase (beta-lactamase superfamily II)